MSGVSILEVQRMLKIRHKMFDEIVRSVPVFREEVITKIKDSLANLSDKVNKEALDINYVQEVEKKNGDIVNTYIYNNLYTFVVAHGIIIPYCDWLYDYSFIYEDLWLFYRNKEGKFDCSMINKVITTTAPQTEPDRADPMNLMGINIHGSKSAHTTGKAIDINHWSAGCQDHYHIDLRKAKEYKKKWMDHIKS